MNNSAQHIIIQSWRDGTKKQYQVYLKKWADFCIARGRDPLHLDLHSGIEFLTSLFQQGLRYSALNTARSALSSLSTILGQGTFGVNPIVKRFVRGVFNIRPSRPRYSSTWDVNLVLEFMKENWTLAKISLKHLSLKLVMLLALVTGQRGQTLLLIDIKNMRVTSNAVEFAIPDPVKTSGPGKTQPVLTLPIYKQDLNLCVGATLAKYIEKTAVLRHSTKLLISFVKPHKPISRDTLSRWLLQVMTLAGVDTKIFKAHSTRAASASAAHKHVPIDTILNTVGWSNANTFAKYYHKRIVTSADFGDALFRTQT